MATTIFETQLNDFSRKFLIKVPGAPDPSPTEFLIKSSAINAALFENFLMFDTISFKVYGENIPMVILLNLFGLKGLEALIEQGALKFILWNQMLTYMVDNIPGIDPLQHGTYNTPAHSDPEESIKLGFNWLTKQLRTSDKKNLTRKIRDIYSLPEAKLSGKAIDLSKSAYESGKLKPYGLTPELSSFRDLDVSGRKKLCHCAEEILQYSHLINNNMTSYSKFEFYQIFDDSNNKIHKAANLQRDFNTLCKLENIPDLQILFPEIADPFKQIIKFRNKSSSKKFRTWISDSNDPTSGIEITKEYINAIVDAKGFFQTRTGRLTKNIAMSSIGAGVGALIAGPLGAVSGASVAKALEPVADFGLDMLDEFVLSGLMKGWTPKMFFNDIEKLERIKKQKQPDDNSTAK